MLRRLRKTKAQLLSQSGLARSQATSGEGSRVKCFWLPVVGFITELHQGFDLVDLGRFRVLGLKKVKTPSWPWRLLPQKTLNIGGRKTCNVSLMEVYDLTRANFYRVPRLGARARSESTGELPPLQVTLAAAGFSEIEDWASVKRPS